LESLNRPAGVLELHSLRKSFGNGPTTRVLFDSVSASLAAGASAALLGPSGCGKSTLLHIIAGLEPASGGQVQIGDKPITPQDQQATAMLRRTHVGFVFQAFHLLPQLDTVHNVMVPLLLQQTPYEQSRYQAIELLKKLGLNRPDQAVQELSGGEQQRVAIARALIHQPVLVLADEPTGNLDPDKARSIMNLLIEQTQAFKAALLMVTHSEACASRCEQRWQLQNQGLVVG
jgi:putative ABC transport system ATP-binding protein